MSFIVSDQISEMLVKLNLVTGQAMDDTDFITFLNDANEYMNTGYKMPTTEKQTDLLLFNGVNEYALPSDFAGIIQPKRSYGQWSPNFEHETSNDFVHWPYGFTTSLKFDRENQYLVANCPTGFNLSLNSCDSLTENGTWAISGDGSALTLDNQIYTNGTGSLKFTITDSGGTTTLTCTGMQAVDLTDLATQYAFLDLQCPDITTDISSVSLKIGSDASNYYTVSATTRYRGDSISQGWGLIGFDLSQKTTTGTPDITQIDYVSVEIANGLTGTSGTYRLDNIFIAESVYFQLPYYSQYNIKASDGSYKPRITAIDDTVLCPNGSEVTGVYTYKTLEVANALRFKDSALASYCERELKPREKYLKSKYPRQESRISHTWYKPWRFGRSRGVRADSIF